MLAVASEDAERARARLEDEWMDGLTEEQRERADAAIDLDAARWTCPACGEEFDGGQPRCPGCGLSFGG